MGKKARTIWTHTAYLMLDAGEEDEASLLRVGDARLTGDRFLIELVPGLSVSGRIVLKVRKELSD